MSTEPVLDPIMLRLEEQIDWYDGKSVSNQKLFKGLKVTELVAAAIIPLLATVNIPLARVFAGALGAMITVVEGVIHLNQYQQNWIMYRSTCESLKSERYSYLGAAVPYKGVSDPRALLAERIQAVLAGENAKWMSVGEQSMRAVR